MKTKRRSVNTDMKGFTKKIVTRNMQNKTFVDKVSSESLSCQSSLPDKPSPNTRAKCPVSGKLEFDPYVFSKLNEECKLPMKNKKMTEKTIKDVSVNTCDFAAMTDPILLGPCEPGTSIELRGIVWLETNTGLLVINVTWRGRTYVGTLLDSTKYEFAPPFSPQDFHTKYESTQSSRLNRGTKYCTKFNNNLTSSAIRHSRRLNDSLSYRSVIKKSQSDPCYIDSFSLSAEVSFSGESDSELNTSQKYSLAGKTRSVTRSLAKQAKVAVNENDSSFHDVENFIQCSEKNCFKRFIDKIALSYHLQRSHGILEETVKTEMLNNVNGFPEDLLTLDNKAPINGLKPHFPKLNETIEIKNENIINRELNTDEKYEENKVDQNCAHSCGLMKEEKEENQLLELSVNISKLSGNLSDYFESGLSTKSVISSKVIPTVQNLVVHIDEPDPFLVAHNSKSNVLSTNLDVVSSYEYAIVQSCSTVRTITAPIVSVPLETAASVTCASVLSNSNFSPTFIKPKPTVTSSNMSFNSQLKKSKTAKNCVYDDDKVTSFQVPNNSSWSKKRQLIPLTDPTTSASLTANQNSNVKPISTNKTSSKQFRPTIITNVTPILPATGNFSTVSSAICNSSLSSSTTFSAKRPKLTSSVATPPTITSLLSLKPIQPKPKSSNTILSYPSPTTPTFVNPVNVPTLPGTISTPTSYQRQILPSPTSKIENCYCSEDKVNKKFDPVQCTSIKKKRRRPDKKLRINFHEYSRLKNLSLNHIQPKRNIDSKESDCKRNVVSASLKSYKMDEENSHSPGYSDFSETCDTPAPILEKEIEIKTNDCDKLIICTDFETTVNKVSSSGPDNDDENKDNKPPALIPAVLSTELLNGATNDANLSESLLKSGRNKVHVSKKLPIVSDQITNLSTCASEFKLSASITQNPINDSSRKSFGPSTSSIMSLKPPIHNSTLNKQIQKIKFPNKSSNLSAINDYVWMTKNSHDMKTKLISNCDKTSTMTKVTQSCDSTKKIMLPTQSPPSNGKFSVQALTSSQEIVSRSFPSSTTLTSANPNTKLTSTLFKN